MQVNILLILVIGNWHLVNCLHNLTAIINAWCASYVDLESFSQSNHSPTSVPDSWGPNSKLVSHWDLPEFLAVAPQNGRNRSINEEVNHVQCYRKVCSKDIGEVLGDINGQDLQGPGLVTFQDGSKIMGFFQNSSLVGLAVEFDPLGRQIRIGSNPELGSTPYWYFNPSFRSAVLYSSPFEAIYLVGNQSYKVALDNHRIQSGHQCSIQDTLVERGILILVPEIKARAIPEFKAPPYLKSIQDFVIAQTAWLQLQDKIDSDYSSIFVRPNEPLDRQIDPNGISRSFLDSTQAKCHSITQAIALKSGSFHEYALVCALGSGSKWIGSLVESSTGLQGYIDAAAGPRYQLGAGMFLKTHHQILQHVDDARRREALQWRMNHILKFQGRGILLLRNPYKTVISHWNHRNAGNEVSSLPDRELVSTLRTKRFQHFATLELKIWLDIALDWLSVSPRLLVIHYENFLADTLNQLKHIHEFLSIPLDGRRLQCIEMHSTQMFKRKNVNLIPQDVFPPHLVTSFDEAILTVNAFIQYKGLEPIPISKYEFSKLSTKNNQNSKEKTKEL